jgi:hypothetical protein
LASSNKSPWLRGVYGGRRAPSTVRATGISTGPDLYGRE